MRFLNLCLFLLLNFLLVGCYTVPLILPTSQVSYYHKNDAFVNLGFNGPNLDENFMKSISVEAHLWMDKVENTDIGVKVSRLFTESYTSFGMFPFYRKWFLVKEDFPLGNIGIGSMFLYSNDRGNEISMGGIEGFSCVGFFNRNLSVSIVGRLGLGISRLIRDFSSNYEYLPVLYFGLGPQLVINFEIGGVGFGISGDFQPVVGGDLGGLLLLESQLKIFVFSSLMSVSVNFKF